MMTAFNGKRTQSEQNIKNLLSGLKGKISSDAFSKVSLLVETALDAKTPFHDRVEISRNFPLKINDSSIGKEEDRKISVLGYEITAVLKTEGYCEIGAIMTAQEHRFIGSSPPFIKHPYAPTAFLESGTRGKKGILQMVEKARKLCTCFLSNRGWLFSEAGGLGKLPFEFFISLEPLGADGNTVRDPRVIDMNKLRNLAIGDPKFERLSHEEILNSCCLDYRFDYEGSTHARSGYVKNKDYFFMRD